MSQVRTCDTARHSGRAAATKRTKDAWLGRLVRQMVVGRAGLEPATEGL